MSTASDFLQYLFSRLKDVQPVTQKVGEHEYAIKPDGTLGAPIRELAPQWDKPTLNVSTLTGLADAYAAKLDDFPEDVAFHIVDYRTVQLISLKADQYGRRHVWATAQHAQEAPFKFDHYYDKPESFLIAFRASFLFNEDAMKVQQVCSSVGAGEAVLVSDDGVSQEIQIKSGTVTRSSVALPAEGIPLIPWRTFREATHVQSKFLLRMKGVKDSLPQIALFEIDAKWRLETILSIRKWLETNVAGAKVIA